MDFYLLAAVYGCLVGLSLGLTGGGGSIFAIPLLMYGLGLPLAEAVPASLIAVALTAATGAWYSWRARLLIWHPIVAFSAGGIIGAPAGIIISSYFEQSLLLTGFSCLVFIVGFTMLRKSITRPEEAVAVRALTATDDKEPFCKLTIDGKLNFTTPCAVVLLLSGIVTGLLAGLFGVGGGFLIVPALMTVIEMGIHRAVAASLMIITFIGMAGSISAIIKGELQWLIVIPFVFGSVTGMLFGRLIAGRLAGPVLQRIFAMLVIITGTGMLLNTLLV